MVNNKGLIRIVEASIAILIVLSALLLLAQQRTVRVQEDLSDSLPPILEEIAKDPELRDAIIEYDPVKDTKDSNGIIIIDSDNQDIIDDLENKVRTIITNNRLVYQVRVCDAFDETQTKPTPVICPITQFPVNEAGELFSAERVITVFIGNNAPYDPNKIKIFLWRKSDCLPTSPLCP